MSENPRGTEVAARALLAEDGKENQAVIVHFLQAAGLVVTVAENGRIACEVAVRARKEGQAFDLILLDMEMPELDGYGAAMRLRQEGFTTPIIAITALAMPGDRQKCLQSGCSDYLTKPVQREVLLRTVAMHLKRA